MSKIDRRKALKTLGLGMGSLPFATAISCKEKEADRVVHPADSQSAPKYDKPMTAIVIGAGQRGGLYGNYAIENPDEIDIIGVAEPIPIRNERYSKKHNIPEENRVVTWEHVFERPKFADAVIISTPDNLHYGPCMKALEMGYDVLLEKPVAQTEQECRDILALAKKTGRIVAVCHVLRYAPYFVKLRELIQSGSIGKLISLQHFEPIGHGHFSHSYVRGNWHNSKETTPIILAKSCHDLDILRWIVGEPCESISAFGGLKWFRKENAPEGSTPRCTDGCAVEATCPYSALKGYYREKKRNYVFDFPEDKSKRDEFILEQLKTTNYGRCVYQMDNDQCDHYVTTIKFENDVTASFSMEAFTSYHGRRTRVMGSMGDIVGDMETFTHNDFFTGKSTLHDIKAENAEAHYNHGGGDFNLMKDWIRAVQAQDASLLSSSIDQSIESHIMGFMAEKSRKNGTVEKIEL